jgi:hypothetical protein
VTLELGREDRTITARFWTQSEDMSSKHLFDKTLRMDDDTADHTEFGSAGIGSATECGSVIGKFLFGLRTLKAE